MCKILVETENLQKTKSRNQIADFKYFSEDWKDKLLQMVQDVFRNREQSHQTVEPGEFSTRLRVFIAITCGNICKIFKYPSLWFDFLFLIADSLCSSLQTCSHPLNFCTFFPVTTTIFKGLYCFFLCERPTQSNSWHKKMMNGFK